MKKASALALTLLAAACGGGDDPDLTKERTLPAAIAGDVAAVSQANNQFALDALAALPVEGNGNQFFSPFSISTALWMLDAGAKGDTDAELRAALHATLPGDQAHLAYGAMLESLEVGRSFDLYTLATANRLFGQQDFTFLQPFLDLTATAYKAPLEKVNFREAEVARSTINNWVSEQTDKKIPELLPPDSVDPDSRLYLVNAILFKGKWVDEFDKADTGQQAFTLASGEQVQVETMSKKDDVAMAEIEGGVLGVLPFRGNDMAMMIVMPDEANGLPALEAALTAEKLGTAIQAALARAEGEGQEITVTLPKFKFEKEYDLIPVLRQLGVESAFIDGRADLSGIDGTRELVVEKAVHKAVIQVDEEGAEAAAATAIGVGPTSVPDDLRVNKPFLFLIYDKVTGSILFLGRMQDPRP